MCKRSKAALIVQLHRMFQPKEGQINVIWILILSVGKNIYVGVREIMGKLSHETIDEERNFSVPEVFLLNVLVNMKEK